MTPDVIAVEIPKPTFDDAQRAAEQSGMTASDWINTTVAERLRDQRLAAEFYRRRSLGGDRNTLLAILDLAPDADPIPGDEL
jgi:hypothetical protein